MSLYPVDMCKIRVTGLKKDLPRIIKALHEYGGTHIKTFRHDSLEEGKPLERYGEITEQLVKLESAEKLLGRAPEGIKPMPAYPLDKALEKSRALKLIDRLNALKDKLAGLEDEEAGLKESSRKIGVYKNVHLDFTELQSDQAEVFGGRLPTAKAKQVEAVLKGVTANFDCLVKPYTKAESVVVAAVQKGLEVKAKNALNALGFSEEPLPDIPGKTYQALNRLHNRLNENREAQRTVKAEIKALAEKSYPELKRVKESLLVEKQRAEVTINFSQTKDSFTFEAFLPEENFERAKHVLAKNLGHNALVQKASNKAIEANHEKAPTLLKHAEPIRPFKFLIEFIDLPQSWEIDPTLIFMIFFPIFYGMMLGDAGYGLISLGLAAGLMRWAGKKSMLYPFAKIWFYCAIPALVFGFVYDEFFGFPHHQLLEFVGIQANFYYGLERLHEIQRMLPITLLVGVIAMATGFFFGFLNAWKERHFGHAWAKLGWFFVVVSGTFLVSAAMFNVFPEMLVPSGVVFLLALIPILKAEGPIALIEIPGVAGNILSFARILAVGLASVVVAVILNDLVLPDPSQGLVLFLTLPLYVFGHVFNTFLGMFESLIQGARLNYVEFFSKFYHGGGKAFTPFKAERKFTKE